MKIPTVRVVFDRKKVASRQKKGLIQIEVLYERKRKWMSTGIKVYKDQWDDRRWVVNSSDMYDVNDNLRQQVEALEKWLRDNFSLREAFTWEKLERYLQRARQSDNYLEFLVETINGRNDIRPTTKRVHRKIANALKEFGKIMYFSDLTPANIMDFDNWLHGRKIRKLDKDGNEYYAPLRQGSIYDFHKTNKIYINMAIRRGLLASNPYDGLHFKRGGSEEGRYLNEEEFRRFETAAMSTGSVAQARDLFIFQAYTGLSYSDLKAFDYGKVEKGVYKGKRVKTGEQFVFPLLPKAMEILKKYHYKLPVPTNEVYNRALKRAARDAGIDKPLATHWARRTAAVLLANHKVPYEIVAKILGHSDVKTTAEFYARLNDETVIEAMKRAGL